MKRSAIETRVIHATDQVLAGHRVEDAQIECKLTFPDDESKTANQIAGLCNAAGGEPIIIVVGVDESTGTVQTPTRPDTADWWARVTKYFDEGVHPDMIDVHVPVGNGATVLALALTTDRAPFLTKTKTGGEPSLWVPWRDGTRTRAARRHELLRILADHTVLPQVEPINAEMTLNSELHTPIGGSMRETKFLTLDGSLFFSVTHALFLPTHKQRLILTGEGHPQEIPMSITFTREAPYASSSGAGLVIDRSTVIPFSADAHLETDSDFEEIHAAEVLTVRLTAHVDRAVTDLSVILTLIQRPAPPEGYAVSFSTTPIKKWALHSPDSS